MRAQVLAPILASLLAIISLPPPGAAQAPARPAQEGLRGGQGPLPPPLISAPYSPIPTRPPSTFDIPAPGEDGLTRCREGCSQTYYICLSSDDSSDCAPDWTSCRANCARSSSSTGN